MWNRRGKAEVGLKMEGKRRQKGKRLIGTKQQEESRNKSRG